jgi:DNA-binding CsgD family transcriptional regulator
MMPGAGAPLPFPAWSGSPDRLGGSPAHDEVPPAHDEGALESGEAAGLAAALEEIPSAAYVVWADGRIAFATGAGREASDRAPGLVASRLLASLGGRDETFRVTRILSPGGASHFLAVERDGAIDLGSRVASAAARWGATPRQTEVLGLLALGQANKAIAGALGCAVSTVEIHVTALLTKAGCESRCELVSRIWSGSSGHRPGAQAPERRRGRALPLPSPTGGGGAWPVPLRRLIPLASRSGD